jgi:hypothetical protein
MAHWPATFWAAAYWARHYWAKITGGGLLISYTMQGGLDLQGVAPTHRNFLRLVGSAGLELAGQAAAVGPRRVFGGLALYLRKTLRRVRKAPRIWWYSAEGGLRLAGRAEVSYRPAPEVLKPLWGILDIDILGAA